MRLLPSTLFVVLLPALLANCKKTVDEPTAATCQPPATLVAKAPCESGFSATQLVASDYTLGSSAQFEYQLFVQKDTLANDVSPKNNGWGNASNDRIVIPAEVLADAPKFVVQVLILCSGQQRASKYFAFVRRPVPNSYCYVWALQKQ